MGGPSSDSYTLPEMLSEKSFDILPKVFETKWKKTTFCEMYSVPQ